MPMFEKKNQAAQPLWESGRPFLIAEIGKNFIQTKEERPTAEYLENAKALIVLAKDAGADAVKFQTHRVEDEQLPVPFEAPHFKGMDRYAWVKRNSEATPLSFWKALQRHAQELGIIFFSTPMSRGAADLLEQVGVPFWKVGSGDLLDFVLLDYLASTKKPIILSTGMSTEAEIDKAVAFLKRRSVTPTLLHCVSKYPCPPDEQFLGTIAFLRDRFGVSAGFSSHSLEIESAVAAASLGATVIEKHFSLSRELFGADHKVSLLPHEFRAMVSRIRTGERVSPDAFGEGIKVMDVEEARFRPFFRKTLVYGQDVKNGVQLEPNMIYAMRPQLGGMLPSERYEEVLRRRVRGDHAKYEPVREEDVQ